MRRVSRLAAVLAFVAAPAISSARAQCTFEYNVPAPPAGGATEWMNTGFPFLSYRIRASSSNYGSKENPKYKYFVEVRNNSKEKVQVSLRGPLPTAPASEGGGGSVGVPPGGVSGWDEYQAPMSHAWVRIAYPHLGDIVGKPLCGNGGLSFDEGTGHFDQGKKGADHGHVDPPTAPRVQCKSEPDRIRGGESVGPGLCAQPMATQAPVGDRPPPPMPKQSSQPAIQSPLIHVTPQTAKSTKAAKSMAEIEDALEKRIAKPATTDLDDMLDQRLNDKRASLSTSDSRQSSSHAIAAARPNLAQIPACHGFTTENFRTIQWDGKSDAQVWGLCTQGFVTYKFYDDMRRAGERADDLNTAYDAHSRIVKMLHDYLNRKK